MSSVLGLEAPLASVSIKDLRSSRATSMSWSSVVGGMDADCPTGLRYELKGSCSWWAAGVSGLTTGDKMRTFFCTFPFGLAGKAQSVSASNGGMDECSLLCVFVAVVAG